ncbi:hypothetical protein FOBRF1_003950 [Fusarium oxysporum]
MAVVWSSNGKARCPRNKRSVLVAPCYEGTGVTKANLTKVHLNNRRTSMYGLVSAHVGYLHLPQARCRH